MKSLLFIITLLAYTPAMAQQDSVTADDYSRAESFLGSNTFSKVRGWLVRPNWTAGDRFWYRNTIAEGSEFILVDPAAGTRARAFDHGRLAAALSSVSDTTYTATDLPFFQIDLSDDSDTVRFNVGRDAFRCSLETYACSRSSGSCW